MGAVITIDHNFDAIDRALVALINVGENPREMLDEIGGELVSSTQDRFDEQAGPDGTPWQQSQRAGREGGLTLKKSGDLVSSMTHDVGGNYLDVGVDAGSDLAYAAIHQFGGTAGRNGSVDLPARPYLGFSDQDEMIIQSIIEEFIAHAAGV